MISRASVREPQQALPPGQVQTMNKVPQVTAVFWTIKILSTTVGETGADYLAVHAGLGTAVTGGIMASLLLLALPLQLRPGTGHQSQRPPGTTTNDTSQLQSSSPISFQWGNP
jgi:Repeat of Unknown Function (DUF347)